MWCYEKRLQFPVKIRKTCPKTAQLIISQYGGPDGELSASMRYLAQRYSMPVKKVGGLMTDIGTEEINHMEIICAMVYQLTKNLTPEEAKIAGFDAYYIDHRNARPAYLEAFWKHINWAFVSCSYEWALKEGINSAEFYMNELHPVK